MGFMEIIMNQTQAATKIQSLSRGYLARKTIKQNLEAPSKLPESVITTILSFCPNIPIPINKAISTDLLHIYKETITKRLDVTEEIVNELKNSEIIDLFNKLNDESTKSALTMGFSLKQIATIPSDQLSEYKTQFDNYDIPNDIQNQIDNLSETNGRLNLERSELTTGQLCKILNALTATQRNALKNLYLGNNQLTSLPESIENLTALTGLYLNQNQLTSLPVSIGNLTALTGLYLGNNQLTSLPDSFGNLTALKLLYLGGNQLKLLPESFGNLSALTELHLARNQLTSLPVSFGNLSALTRLYLENNKFNVTQNDAIQQRFNFAVL